VKGWNYENEQWTQLPTHLRHLPLFTRQFDLASYFIRFIWWVFLRHIFFRFYLRIKVRGDFDKVYREHPRLLVIANHSSHLDAISIATAIPFRYWLHLYIAAAKDYFFKGYWMSMFSKHCIGAIPLDRKENKRAAMGLCVSLLQKVTRIWMVIFPEGTRSLGGKVREFKRGVSLFALRSNTPILFLYLENAGVLWPKGKGFAKPGTLTVHVGPVHPPAGIDEINAAYRKWGATINPDSFK